MFLTITFCLFTCVYDSSTVDIMPALKKNILKFGYGVNFKHERMLSHSFDRFYTVTKFELPRVEELKFTTIDFDSNCNYLHDNEKYIKQLYRHCLRIAPYIDFYRWQIAYYNITAYKIMTKDIGLILPTYWTEKRPKWGAILASVLGGIASSIIGLAYEGISSSLYHKRHKALHKAMTVMEKKTDLQHIQIHHLEDTMIMYGVHNSDTLTALIRTVHNMQNATTWKERTFAGKLNQIYQAYLNEEGMHNFAVNSILFLTTVREKYVKMYVRFIEELKACSKAIRILSKGYLAIYLLPPSKLEKILSEVRTAITKSNKGYDYVMTRLYLYFDMKLVTFGIDNKRNLIVQFPVFLQPYTQNGLIMYQIETVPVLILDQNEKAQSYTQLKIDKLYIALDTKMNVTLRTQELHTCKKIGYEYITVKNCL